MRRGEADEFRVGADGLGDAFEIEREVLLEGEIDQRDFAADGAGCFKVGGVVRAHDHKMVAGLEQGGGDDEERAGGAGCHQYVCGRDAAVGGDLVAQGRVAAMVAIGEDYFRQIDVEVGERAVGDGAFGQVVADVAVAALLGRLDLDRHAHVFHDSWLPATLECDCTMAGAQKQAFAARRASDGRDFPLREDFLTRLPAELHVALATARSSFHLAP